MGHWGGRSDGHLPHCTDVDTAALLIHPCRYFNCSAPGAQACSVPASCCLDPWHNGSVVNALCAAGALRLGDAAASTVVYVGGCVAQLSAWLRSQAGVIAAGVAVLVLVEAIGVLMALKVLGNITARG